MDFLDFIIKHPDFIIKAMEFLAWPVIVLIFFVVFRKNISDLLDRLQHVKHGDTEFSFPARKLSHEEKETLIKKRVLPKVGDINNYTLYSNGIFVQKIKLNLKAGVSSFQVTYPLVFPNEVLNIQFVGDVDAKITDIRAGGLDFVFEPAQSDRTIEIIASGL